MTPFKQIVGQATAKKILLRSFDRDRMASTYLFYGPDGTGKWPMAIALTALLNCEQPIRNDDGTILDACGECRNCRQVLNLTFPELMLALPLPPHKSDTEAIELQNEFKNAKIEDPYQIILSKKQTTISIKTAREIKRRAIIKPDEGLKRVILFYQMETMLASSADSLLKLIEEPPPNTIIVLTANNPDNLLPTIQSRSQKIPFRQIGSGDIAEYLTERYELSQNKAQLISRLAEGSIGRAILLAGGEEESPIRQSAFLMFKALLQKDTPSAVATINDLFNPRDRGQVQEILRYWQSFLADLINLKFGKESSDLIHLDLKGEMESLSGGIPDSNGLAKFVTEFSDLNKALYRNVHLRLAITALILRLRRYMNLSA